VTESESRQLQKIDDPKWGGYLANVAPAEYKQYYAPHLPEHIGGAEFLARYQGTTDPVTWVSAEQTYAVRVATTHAIYDHHRVRIYAELLKAAASERRLELLGELMYQSHSSYAACGLSVAGTDRLVELVRKAGAQSLYGAKTQQSADLN
jgi:galactokinase